MQFSQIQIKKDLKLLAMKVAFSSLAIFLNIQDKIPISFLNKIEYFRRIL